MRVALHRCLYQDTVRQCTRNVALLVAHGAIYTVRSWVMCRSTVECVIHHCVCIITMFARGERKHRKRMNELVGFYQWIIRSFVVHRSPKKEINTGDDSGATAATTAATEVSTRHERDKQRGENKTCEERYARGSR